MAKGLGKLKEQIRELGFGSREFSGRLVNKDGSFNVERKGIGLAGFSPYHWLINMHWLHFFLFICVAYILVNLIFALLYMWVGPDKITAYKPMDDTDAFLRCFYFSCQTLTTVGFGRLSPNGHLTSMIASFEAMLGLLSFALATGVLYGRFSKAQAKIMFSDTALVSPFQDITCLKFRIANTRKNHLIEMQAKLMYSYMQKEGDVEKRRYKELNLQINFISMFPLPWTIVHPIDDKSPLHGKSAQDLTREDAEFLIILKGYDDTFSQYVHQAYSYRHEEVIFDADFESMFFDSEAGTTVVHLRKISNYKKLLPNG